MKQHAAFLGRQEALFPAWYLIGVAAAVEFAVFPVWFGFSLVQGSLDPHIVAERLGAFAVNLVTIAGMAALVYAITG